MATTSETGVVDKNCLVFGQKNLYIAGSSVFPSGGGCDTDLHDRSAGVAAFRSLAYILACVPDIS